MHFLHVYVVKNVWRNLPNNVDQCGQGAAREYLVPEGICGNFLWNWQFYWKLPKFSQILCDLAIFDAWVLSARDWIVYQWWALNLSARLCQPPCLVGYSKKKKKKKIGYTDVWLEKPADRKTTDEPNLQPILKPNFLFYSPINEL